VTASRRLLVFATGALLLASAVGWAGVELSGLDRSPGYGCALTTIAVEERGVRNVVAAVLFDLRPSDTLGEALALFVASAGLQLVLRGMVGERRRDVPRPGVPGRSVPATSDAVRVVALGLVFPLVALALFLSLRGHLSIGGGLQGGAVAASALAALFLAGRYGTQRRFATEQRLDHLEALSIGGYVVVGLVGLVVSAAFLENLLPLGVPGELLSTGTIPVLSLLVAIEAAAAAVLIIEEIQEEPLEREDGPWTG
jgi:multicomponent Na+:H+ antiporter subunit B